jgi:cob(I)alamin adenosyltransferase
MISTHKLALFFLWPLCLLLAACSSTPQAALDQANNGTSLMLAMQGEIAKFKTEQAAIASLRIDTIRQAQTNLARGQMITADDDRIFAIAGKKNISDNLSVITGLVDARDKDERALNDKTLEINKSLGGLLTPLPVIDKELKEAQKSLAILGNELSSEERFKIFSAFAKDIKKSVDANKKKIEEAKNAPVAPEENN